MTEEYITKGIVLRRDPEGEHDAQIVLYTRSLGKIRARAKGLGRPTSKSGGHLIPGAVCTLRLVPRRNGGWQVVDALSYNTPVSAASVAFYEFLYKLLPYDAADAEVWDAAEPVLSGELPDNDTYVHLMHLCGELDSEPVCVHCGIKDVRYFLPHEMGFVCAQGKTMVYNEQYAITI